MAHFAKLNNENIVEDVIVVNNNVLLDDNGVEQEKLGIDLCKHIYNYQNFKQTSYNGSFRYNFASKGFVYDEVRDAFIPPKPFESWILNEETCTWNPPIERPSDDTRYTWNEENVRWELIDL